MSHAMDGHGNGGNPFWSRRAQEELEVRLARPESLPEELPLVPEEMQDELGIEAGYERPEDLVEFENELRASSAVQANGPESAGEDQSRGELSGQLQADGAGGAISASALPEQAGPWSREKVGLAPLMQSVLVAYLDKLGLALLAQSMLVDYLDKLGAIVRWVVKKSQQGGQLASQSVSNGAPGLLSKLRC